MSSKKEIEKSGNAVSEKNKTSEDHLAAAMADVRKILKLTEEGLDTNDIASKIRVGVSYVAEVISKGEETMEAQLRTGYGIPPKETAAPVVDTTPIENVTETAAQKKERVSAEKAAEKEKAKADTEAAKEAKKAEKEAAKAAKANQTPKKPNEKRTRENAILKALEETNGAGLTQEAVGNRTREILGIERKSWTGTLGAMRRAGEITYNKETKLYNLP